MAETPTLDPLIGKYKSIKVEVDLANRELSKRATSHKQCSFDLRERPMLCPERDKIRLGVHKCPRVGVVLGSLGFDPSPTSKTNPREGRLEKSRPGIRTSLIQTGAKSSLDFRIVALA